MVGMFGGRGVIWQMGGSLRSVSFGLPLRYSPPRCCCYYTYRYTFLTHQEGTTVGEGNGGIEPPTLVGVANEVSVTVSHVRQYPT